MTRAPQHVARWRALGTYAHLQVRDAAHLEEAFAVASEVLEEVDRACSRFRPDSDLTRVNAARGRHRVSPVLVAAVRVALEAAEDTGGLVDPTLCRVLVGAGYDRTFAAVAAVSPDPVDLPSGGPSWPEIRVLDDRTLDVPERVGLDLGATGKAFAAELVAHMVAAETGGSVVVSLGGDVASAGGGPDWPVAIGVRAGDRPHARVRLVPGCGLATSSPRSRRWTRGGTAWHHVVDPRTGAPAPTRWAAVSVVAPTATSANAASTAAVVLGSDAPAWLSDRAVAALLVGDDGSVTTTPAWPGEGGRP